MARSRHIICVELSRLDDCTAIWNLRQVCFGKKCAYRGNDQDLAPERQGVARWKRVQSRSMSGETENSHFLHFLNMISFQSRHRGRTASYPTIPLTRPRQSQSPPPSTHTIRTPTRLSAGLWPRTFDKLTSSLALVRDCSKNGKRGKKRRTSPSVL